MFCFMENAWNAAWGHSLCGALKRRAIRKKVVKQVDLHMAEQQTDVFFPFASNFEDANDPLNNADPNLNFNN